MRLPLLVATFAAALCDVHATTYVWDGGGANNNWSSAGNWNPNGAPPDDGTATVRFAGSTRRAPNAEAPYSVNAIFFNSGAGAFTLGGEELTIGVGGITQASAATQTINNSLVLDDDQTWTVSSGILNIGSAAFVDAGISSLTIHTAAGTSANLAGGIGGDGSLTKTGTGSLTLGSLSDVAGAVYVTAGTLTIPAGASLSGEVEVDAGANLKINGTVEVTSDPADVGLSIDGSATSTATATLSAGGSLTVTVSEVVGASGIGKFIHSAGTHDTEQLELGRDAGGSGTYQLSGTGALSALSEYIGEAGTGSFVQSGGSNTVGDLLTVGSDTGSGTYTLSSTGVLATGDETIATAGRFTQTGGTHTVENFLQLDGVYTLAGSGVFRPGAITGEGTIQFNGGILQATGNDDLLFPFISNLGAALVQAGGAKVDTNGFTITIDEPLQHDPALGTAADGGLTKLGGGTLILDKPSTYTGPTSIQAGVLVLADNLDPAAPGSGKLTKTSSLSVHIGGKLLLSGTAAEHDRINNAASFTLEGGGLFGTGGLSEGTAPLGPGGAGGAVGLGAFILALTSSINRVTLDFDNSTAGSALVFSSLASSGKGAFVTISNWTGLATMDDGLPTNDRLLFLSNPGFTLKDLANWQFTDDSGVSFAPGAMQVFYNGYYEIVPVPEPSPALLAGMAGVLGLSLRRRRPAFPWQARGKLPEKFARASASAQ